MFCHVEGNLRPFYQIDHRIQNAAEKPCSHENPTNSLTRLLVARATLVTCGLLIALSVFKNALTMYLQAQRSRFKKSNSWTELQSLWQIVSTQERSLVLLAASITHSVKRTTYTASAIKNKTCYCQLNRKYPSGRKSL